jgi:hypothetical protein
MACSQLYRLFTHDANRSCILRTVTGIPKKPQYHHIEASSGIKWLA